MFSPNHLRGIRVALTLDNQIAESALWGSAMMLAKILTPEGTSPTDTDRAQAQLIIWMNYAKVDDTGKSVWDHLEES